jgi:hypothetical protein
MQHSTPSEIVVDRDATARCVEAGLVVEVRHHPRDDVGRLVEWATEPDDDQRERAETLLAGYCVHHAS